MPALQNTASFRTYRPDDLACCLALFDENCPEFFAPNERADYEGFLRETPSYVVATRNDRVVGAYGVSGRGRHSSLNWILLARESQGLGLGSTIMKRAVARAIELKTTVLCIAASHKSAPFFTKFSAFEVKTIRDGWGPDMHRIDMELHLSLNSDGHQI
ncbi:GNAT family N-acetyltransferase [Congregibacter brevis]|uniref:GNAT family N-acetyltransferase n=1 Tax=Congregibacter brevis TaxID=3081201 RepID=A0ABZ0I9P6_9GAMM|nr:GNAT family N-acetyltransferase [Congregibacter sp. IMCC45268]